MSWAGLDDFLARVDARLDPPRGPQQLAVGGDLDFVPAERAQTIRDAAVLVGIVPRAGEPVLVLTLRPKTMPTHAGQVAFPGGKIEPADKDEVAAALREASEEVGVEADKAHILARSAPYITGTAFRIVPVLGLLPIDFEARPDPTEVEAAFETPLSFLMDPENHVTKSGVWGGKVRHYYEMPHNGFRIWGVTAGIIRSIYERLYLGETN